MSAAMIPDASRARAPTREDGALTRWTSEADALLLRLYREGLPYSQVAAAINRELGTSFSRNAAIGRAGRLGIAGSAKAPRSTRSNLVVEKAALAAKVTAAPAQVRPAPEPALAAAVTAVSKHASLLSLFDLRDSTCRFPRWPDQERAPAPDVPAYCGARVPVPGKTPYCEGCAGRAFTPREERRRLRV